MEAQDPLSQLADIHLPQTVGFWPPAPGWWVLAALLAVLLFHLARLGLNRWRKQRRMAAALQELALIQSQYAEKANFESMANQAGLDYLRQLNTLLKRVALQHFPAAQVASLNGQDWLHFLDDCDQSSVFTQGPGQVLGDGLYRPRFEADTQALEVIVRHWIERRYRQADDRPGNREQQASPSPQPEIRREAVR